MKSRGYPIINVSRKAQANILAGHPWVFDSEIRSIDGIPENGDVVDIVSDTGAYLATGFFNANSKIRLRVLTQNANDKPDDAFFERAVKRAVEYRATVMGEQFSCCRLIFGEADGLPGLTVDLFEDVLVAQVLSLGVERRKCVIFAALVNALKECGVTVRGVYERNDLDTREREGMEQGKGWLELEGSTYGETSVCITENGIKYIVDFENGQKTGFFLDQKFNRAACARLAKGKRVLDCFTNTGSFALNMARGGAQSVTAVDISADAIECARRHAQINGIDTIEFRCENVFDMLSTGECAGKYDFIVLDPPAFTKSRKTVDKALRGYKEINLRAMKLLPRGGYLATCSCSHFVTDTLFRQMLHSAALDAGVKLRQIEARQQACDHPILWNAPETEYLKFYIFQKC